MVEHVLRTAGQLRRYFANEGIVLMMARGGRS